MFDTFESSARGGKPRHLFLFGRQAVAWRYSSGQKNVVIAGKTYLAAPIERSEIKQTIEKPQDQITITFPYNRDPAATETPVTQALGDNWHPYIPSDTITVVCMAFHEGDPDAQAIVEWQGIVQQPKFTDGQLELTCVPNSAIDRAKFQGPKFQTGCWKTVYGTGVRGCNLDPAPLTTAGTLTAVDGLAVTAAEFVGLTLSLAGGALWWTRSDGIVERRSIMGYDGSTGRVTLLYGAADLAVGLDVQARPGCERTWAACTARDNTINYGGAIYKPVDNPYNGTSMSWS